MALDMVELYPPDRCKLCSVATDVLTQLEHWLVELARKWERYVSRDPQVPLPPERERAALERRLREISRQEMRTVGERFRLEQLLHRFSMFNQLWIKQLRDREVGTARSEVGRAAPNARASLPVPPPRDECAALHAHYAELVGRTGGTPLPLEQFRGALEAQRRSLEQQGAVVEGFDVAEMGGRVRIQARVRRGRDQ